VFWWTGLYQGLWRFASIPDLWNIVRACVLGAFGISLGLFLITRLEGVPRSVFFIYPVILMVLLGMPRLLYRFWKDHRLASLGGADRQRVIVLGAGRGGETLARDMRLDPEYTPVGFVDDDVSLRGARLQGLRVYGTLDQLPEVIRRANAQLLVIAMPSADNTQMRRAVELCEASGLPFRTLPRLQDMVSGRMPFNQLKEVAIDDLLGRDPVSLDWDAISRGLVGRRVLVTGGGGSVGAELCRQVARLGPLELMVLDNGEYNLYRIEMELHRDYPDLALQARLADVCDVQAVEHHLSAFQPDVVFHAAAYKHVPLLQHHIREAVRNNVFGTINMARAADRAGVGTFVLISTDKAVNPGSVMGATKRVAELYCQSLQTRTTTGMRFITVRFGNVLDSAGSVVPLFRQQIARGGPVTVTHPEISRYFMTIPESCELILQAAVLGEGGEIFVLDMGEPVKIRYLAEQMIQLVGKVPGRDIEIVYSGLRPGEKLFEELFYEQEEYSPTGHEKILLARDPRADWAVFHEQLGRLEELCAGYDEAEMESLIYAIVPELAAADNGENVVPFDRKKA
jgi:FlaA1/EpsC-like NDP-sugar epimerase